MHTGMHTHTHTHIQSRNLIKNHEEIEMKTFRDTSQETANVIARSQHEEEFQINTGYGGVRVEILIKVYPSTTQCELTKIYKRIINVLSQIQVKITPFIQYVRVANSTIEAKDTHTGTTHIMAHPQ